MNKKETIEGFKNKIQIKLLLGKVDVSWDEFLVKIHDVSLGGKYSLWVISEYAKGNIKKYEDLDRVKQALILFRNNLCHFPEDQKQLNKYSFSEVEEFVSYYSDKSTSKYLSKLDKQKIKNETKIIIDTKDFKIIVPQTKEAGIFWGQGTRWCTAAVNNNMFNGYNRQGYLFIVLINSKDETGRQIKYQLHPASGQYMDAKDNFILPEKFKEIKNLIDLCNISDESKLDIFLNNPSNFSLFGIPYQDSENLNKKDIVKNIRPMAFFATDDIFFIDEYTEGIVEHIIECKLFEKNYFDEKIFSKEQRIKMLKYFCMNFHNNNSSEIPQDDFFTFFHEKINEKIQGGKYDFSDLIENSIEKLIFEFDLSIEFVPKHILNKKICDFSVNKNIRNIKYVPAKFIDEELIYKVVSSSPEYRYFYNDGLIENISNKKYFSSKINNLIILFFEKINKINTYFLKRFFAIFGIILFLPFLLLLVIFLSLCFCFLKKDKRDKIDAQFSDSLDIVENKSNYFQSKIIESLRIKTSVLRKFMPKKMRNIIIKSILYGHIYDNYYLTKTEKIKYEKNILLNRVRCSVKREISPSLSFIEISGGNHHKISKYIYDNLTYEENCFLAEDGFYDHNCNYMFKNKIKITKLKQRYSVHEKIIADLNFSENSLKKYPCFHYNVYIMLKYRKSNKYISYFHDKMYHILFEKNDFLCDEFIKTFGLRKKKKINRKFSLKNNIFFEGKNE